MSGPSSLMCQAACKWVETKEFDARQADSLGTLPDAVTECIRPFLLTTHGNGIFDPHTILSRNLYTLASFLLRHREAPLSMEAFFYAALIGDQIMVERILNYGSLLDLKQEEVNESLKAAACGGQKKLVEHLLSRAYPLGGVPHPSQQGINEALEATAVDGNVDLIEHFLNRPYPPEGVPSPNQNGINNLLMAVTQRGDIHLVEHLLSRAYPLGGVPHPSQQGINEALGAAAVESNVDLIEHFLNRPYPPEGVPSPNQ
ncbi:MAG TPA: hypothetical protein DCY54_03405, partial [Parachlamydiales bacterium]|nr:hypothetical protein [Parachlamydiales bacterium]